MNTNKRLMRDVDAEEGTQGMQKKRPVQSPSSELWSPHDWLFNDLSLEKKIPVCLLSWSDLMKYCDSALYFQLVGLCHSLISTEALEPLKALKFISSPATNTMSIDVQSVYNSLEHVLHSKNDELIQLACSAVAFLSWCCRYNYVKPISFGAGLVNKLFNLVEKEKDLGNNKEMKGSHDSPVQAQARLAICSIAFVDELVRQEISEKTKHGYPFFEWPFLYGDELKAEHACAIVACIVGGKKDDDTWDKVEGVLIPPMVKVLTSDCYGTGIVSTAAAYAVSRATNGATHAHIEKLVGMECLLALCNNITSWCPLLVNHCLDGIEGILRAGVEQGNNKYVEWIANDDSSPGWMAFEVASWIFEEGGIKSSFENKAYRIGAEYGHKHCQGWRFWKFIKDLFPQPPDDDDDDDDDHFYRVPR